MRTIPVSRLKQGQDIAETCVHFGFCTSVCPTYLETGEENDSPRGRIALIKDMLATEQPPSAQTVHYLDRCLSCLSCVTTCAASVDYRNLIDIARERIEASGVRPLRQRLWRKALHYIMTRPSQMRRLLRFGQPFLHFESVLPNQLVPMARLASIPVRLGLVSEVNHRADTALSRQGQKDTRNGPAVALLEGCAQSVVGTEINAAARRVLERCGIAVVDIAGEACCGALSLHMGYRSAAEARARHLIMVWDQLLQSGKIQNIVITTSGCGSVIQHYEELFENDPDMRQRAARVAAASEDISVYLQTVDLPPAGQSHQRARVAYHDSCSLLHGQKISNPPRQVLKQLGFEVMDIAERHVCCGSAGVYNVLQADMAQALGQRKAKNIVANGPDVFTAGNLGCLLQIAQYAAVPAAHFVQLVDWATGGKAPKGLDGFTPPPVVTPEEKIVDTGRVPAVVASDDFW